MLIHVKTYSKRDGSDRHTTIRIWRLEIDPSARRLYWYPWRYDPRRGCPHLRRVI